MNQFWKFAVGVSGLAAIGAFVFWSLYRGWLEKLGPVKLQQKQWYRLFWGFLLLTFLFAVLCVLSYVLSVQAAEKNSNSAIEGLRSVVEPRYTQMQGMIDRGIDNRPADLQLRQVSERFRALTNEGRISLRSKNLVYYHETQKKILKLLHNLRSNVRHRGLSDRLLETMSMGGSSLR